MVLTVGRELDPAQFGPQPAHVRVERLVPQADVLREVDLVVLPDLASAVSVLESTGAR